MNFFFELGLGLFLFLLLLRVVEKRYSFRKRFQEKFGQGKMKVSVIIFSFILIIFGASLVQVVIMSLPFLMEIEGILSGLRLGVLIYLLHIINPFIREN